MPGPAMARGPLAPGLKGGQSSPRRRRPAGWEACCACVRLDHSLRRRIRLMVQMAVGGVDGPEELWPLSQMGIVVGCAAAPA